jgi:hypothetical protein
VVNVDKLERGATAEAARVTIRAFLRNPLHVAAFKGDSEALRRRQEAMYKTIFDHFPGELLAARWGTPLVGVLGMTLWARLRSRRDSGTDGVAPASAGPWRAVAQACRVAFGLGGAAPKGAALAPGARGRAAPAAGPGCWESDGAAVLRPGRPEEVPGYLETDKPENVTLYERFGFKVTGEAKVFGVPNWFMWREPEPEFLKRKTQIRRERV